MNINIYTINKTDNTKKLDAIIDYWKSDNEIPVKNIVIYGNGDKTIIPFNDFISLKNIRKNRNGNDQLFEVSDYQNGISNIKINSIFLTTEIKNAKKENLNRKDNYFLTAKKERFDSYNYKDLYIHESEIEIVYNGETLHTETDSEKDYINTYKLYFKTGIELKYYHFEKIVIPDSQKEIPIKELFPELKNANGQGGYGSKEYPEYKFFSNDNESGIMKQWIEIEEKSQKTLLIKIGCFCRTEYSKERQQINKIVNFINQKNILGYSNKISHYDLEKLTKYFDITPKKGIDLDETENK